MIVCGSWFVGVHITSTQWLCVVVGLLECILLAHTQWLCVVVGLLECILLAHSDCVW